MKLSKAANMKNMGEIYKHTITSGRINVAANKLSFKKNKGTLIILPNTNYTNKRRRKGN